MGEEDVEAEMRTKGGFYLLDVDNLSKSVEERFTQRVMCVVYYGMRDFIYRPINFFHDLFKEDSSEL